MDLKGRASADRCLLNLRFGLRMLDKQRRHCTRPQNAWAARTGPNARVPPLFLQPLGNEIHAWRFHCSTFFWQPPGWIHFLPSLSVF